MKRWFLPLVFLIFLFVSCGETTGEKPKNKGLAAFKVEFADDFDLGSPEKRRNDVGDSIETTITITALGYDNKPLADYNGTVRISMLYGRNNAPAILDAKDKPFTDGQAKNIRVQMKYCLDHDRVIVEEMTDEVYELTGKSGVSPIFYTNIATISAIQSSINKSKSTIRSNGKAEGNESNFDRRNFTLKDREMVVIAVLEGGFYLHEVGVDDYSSIYMYTYSTPYVDDNREDKTLQENDMSAESDEDPAFEFLPVGTLIESANGSVYEFFGFTEMSFPTFKPVYVEKDGKKTLKIDRDLIPKPYDIGDFLDDDSEMEKHEASLVKIKNVSVGWFPEDDSSFVEYSQFPLETSDKKTIMAQTLYTAPLFDALAKRPENENEEAKCRYNFTGILKQHTSARPSSWIIVPRNMEDIEPTTLDSKCKLK